MRKEEIEQLSHSTIGGEVNFIEVMIELFELEVYAVFAREVGLEFFVDRKGLLEGVVYALESGA